MNVGQIRTLLKPYGLALSDDETSKVDAYLGLLSAWNQKIALTSIREEDEMLRCHFGESLFALKICEMRHGRLADVGTGAGFPGLAIKILRPELQVVLVERNKKKCAFLHEVVRKLELHGVEILPIEYGSSTIEANSLSFVTSRALGNFADLLTWAKRRLLPMGSIAFWIGREDCEKVSAIPGWSWGGPALIPGTSNRMILSGTPKIPG